MAVLVTVEIKGQTQRGYDAVSETLHAMIK